MVGKKSKLINKPKRRKKLKKLEIRKIISTLLVWFLLLIGWIKLWRHTCFRIEFYDWMTVSWITRQLQGCHFLSQLKTGKNREREKETEWENLVYKNCPHVIKVSILMIRISMSYRMTYCPFLQSDLLHKKLTELFGHTVRIYN